MTSRLNELPGEPGIQAFAALASPERRRETQIAFDWFAWSIARKSSEEVFRTSSELPRKEVIQPQVPLRLPCYDFTPITSHTLGGSLPKDFHPGFDPHAVHAKVALSVNGVTVNRECGL